MVPPVWDWSLQDTWPTLFTNSDLLAVWTELCCSPCGNVGGSCPYLWSGQSTRQDKADYNILLVQTVMATHCPCIHTVSSFFHVPWFLDSRLQKLHECFFFSFFFFSPQVFTVQRLWAASQGPHNFWQSCTNEFLCFKSEFKWILKLPNQLWADWSFSALLNFQVKSLGTITEPVSPPQSIETYCCLNQNLFNLKKILAGALGTFRDSGEWDFVQ